MKKVLTLAGTMMATLALASCNGGNGGSNSKNEYPGANFLPENGAVIKFGEANEGLPFAKELAEQFMKDYKEFNITVEEPYLHADDTFQLDAPAGKGADVIVCSHDRSYLYTNHLIMPVDPAIRTMENYTDVPEWAWDAFSYQGTQYGYPLTVQTANLYYRKSLVPNAWKDEKGNLNVKTWNDVYKLNKEILDGKHPGLTAGIMSNVGDFYRSWGMLKSYGGVLFENGDRLGTDLAKGEAWKGAKVIRDIASVMYQEPSNWEVFNQIPNNMALGTTLGIYETPNKVQEIVNSISQKDTENYPTVEKAKEDIGSLPLPRLPKSGDVTKPTAIEDTIPCAAMGGCTGVYVSAYTKYPNASRLFATYVAQRTWQMQRAHQGALTPVRSSCLNDPALPSYLKTVFVQAEENGIEVIPNIAEMGQVWGPGTSAMAKLANNHIADAEQFGTVNSDEELKNLLATATKQIKDAITVLA